MPEIERDYIEVETPIGKFKLKLKAWLTGAEKLQLGKVDRTDNEASSRAAIEVVVVGTTFEEIGNMHGKDFDFVLEEVSKVIQGSSLSPKAQGSATSTAS